MLPVPPRWTALAVLLVVTTAAAQPPAPPPAGQPPAGKPGDPKMGDKDKKPEEKPFEWPKSIGGKSMTEWVGEMKSADPTARDAATRVMPLFGPDARKAASKELTRLIGDPDPGIRINAMLSLNSLGFDGREDMRAAAAAIATNLNNTVPGSMLRLHGCRTLASMGPDADNALNAIIAVSNDPSWETRQAAATALGRIGGPVFDDKPPEKSPAGAPPKPPVMKKPPSKVAMDKLVYTLLDDKSSAVRMEATQSLITIGPPHQPTPEQYVKVIAPYLTTIAERLKAEKNPGVRVWLLTVQGMYDNRVLEANAKKIAENLSDTVDAGVRVQSLTALGVFGPEAKPVQSEIASTLRHKESDVVLAAIGCIASMGTDGKFAIADLEILLKETKDEYLKKLAAEGIKALKGMKVDPNVVKKGDPKKDPPKKE